MRRVLIAGWMLLAGLAGAAAPAVDQAALLGTPVPSIIGLRPAPEGSRFAKPFIGPRILCDGVERQIVVLNPEIVEGEPVLVRLILRSTTPGRKQEFKARLAFGTDFNVNVFPPQGMAPYTYQGTTRGTIVPTNTMEMTRVSAFRMPFRMAMDEDTVTGAAFDRAGDYRLQFLLDCIKGEERPSRDILGEVNLVVRPAEGDDRKALDILSQDHTVYLYLNLQSSGVGRDRPPVGDKRIALIRRVIDEAPAARIRPHAMFVLADYLGTTRSIPEAEPIYRRIIAEYPGTPFEEEAWFAILRCQSESLDWAAAFETFCRLWQDPYSVQLLSPGGGYYRTFAEPYLKVTPGGQWMIQDRPGPDPDREGTPPPIGVGSPAAVAAGGAGLLR